MMEGDRFGRVYYKNKQRKRKYGGQDLDFPRVWKILQKNYVRNVCQQLVDLQFRIPAVLKTQLDLPILPRDSKHEVVLDGDRDIQRLMVLNRSGNPPKRRSKSYPRGGKAKPIACRSGFGGRWGWKTTANCLIGWRPGSWTTMEAREKSGRNKMGRA